MPQSREDARCPVCRREAHPLESGPLTKAGFDPLKGTLLYGAERSNE
jgi:hypothetical protein